MIKDDNAITLNAFVQTYHMKKRDSKSLFPKFHINILHGFLCKTKRNQKEKSHYNPITRLNIIHSLSNNLLHLQVTVKLIIIS